MTLCIECKFCKDPSEFDPQYLKKPLEERICRECCRTESKSSASSTQQNGVTAHAIGAQLAENITCESCGRADAVKQSEKSGAHLCARCLTNSQKHRMKSVEADVKKRRDKKDYNRPDDENDTEVHEHQKDEIIIQDNSALFEGGKKRSKHNGPSVQAHDDVSMGCGASKQVESQTEAPQNRSNEPAAARPSLARQATKTANEDPKSLQFLNAAKDGNFGTLKAFASIVDLNVKDDSGDFALIWACRNGNTEMVDYLITKRNKGMKWTDVDQKNHAGRTPLHEASAAGHANIVSLLLEHNANPDVKDNKGKTPKELAKNAETEAAFEENARKQESIATQSEKPTSEVEEAAEGEEITDKEKRDFFEAAMYGDMDKIKAYVVIRNIDVNIVDPADWTAVMAASQRGNEDVVKYLIANGAKVDMVNNSNATALHYADNGTIAKLLIDNGAPVSVQNEFGESALHTACNAHFVSPGILSVVDLLIESGADCNLRNNEGQTPLHIAVRQEHKALVEKLVKNGRADASIKDNKGQTPMDLATTDDIRYLM